MAKSKNRAKTGKNNPPKDHQFKKGHSGNPKGRPRKLVNTLIREMSEDGVRALKPTQVISAYEILLNMTQAEVKKLSVDPDQPIFIRVICKAIISNRGVEMINEMLDRAHGKSRQSMELNGKLEMVDDIDYSLLSDATLKEVLAAKRK